MYIPMKCHIITSCYNELILLVNMYQLKGLRQRIFPRIVVISVCYVGSLHLICISILEKRWKCDSNSFPNIQKFFLRFSILMIMMPNCIGVEPSACQCCQLYLNFFHKFNHRKSRIFPIIILGLDITLWNFLNNLNPFISCRGRKCWRWCDLGEKNICWFKCFYTIF